MPVPTKSSPLHTRRGPTPAPLPVAGIQVNFCKNPNCSQFRLPPSQKHPARGKAAAGSYRFDIKKPGVPKLVCAQCGCGFVVKSNLAVHEELMRLAATSDPCIASAAMRTVDE